MIVAAQPKLAQKSPLVDSYRLSRNLATNVEENILHMTASLKNSSVTIVEGMGTSPKCTIAQAVTMPTEVHTNLLERYSMLMILHLAMQITMFTYVYWNIYSKSGDSKITHPVINGTSTWIQEPLGWW